VQAGEPSAWEKLTDWRIRPSRSRQHSAPKSKWGSHFHGRYSLAVGSGHRALVSTLHLEQAESSAWEKLTGCWIRHLGSRQRSAPRASGRAICMGETHRLSDQAIGLSSALSTSEQAESSAWEKLTGCRIKPLDSGQRSAPKSEWGSHLHGRNSPAVGSGHRALVSTQHLRASGVICMGNSQAVGSSHRALVSARHLEQVGQPSAWEKLTRCRIRPPGSRQHSTPQSKRSGLHGRNSQAVRSGHRALVSTLHLQQVGEPSAWEKLTRCRIRPSGSRQGLAPRARGGAICMGETHKLSDQAIGLSSALGT